MCPSCRAASNQQTGRSSSAGSHTLGFSVNFSANIETSHVRKRWGSPKYGRRRRTYGGLSVSTKAIKAPDNSLGAVAATSRVTPVPCANRVRSCCAGITDFTIAGRDVACPPNVPADLAPMGADVALLSSNTAETVRTAVTAPEPAPPWPLCCCILKGKLWVPLHRDEKTDSGRTPRVNATRLKAQSRPPRAACLARLLPRREVLLLENENSEIFHNFKTRRSCGAEARTPLTGPTGGMSGTSPALSLSLDFSQSRRSTVLNPTFCGDCTEVVLIIFKVEVNRPGGRGNPRRATRTSRGV